MVCVFMVCFFNQDVFPTLHFHLDVLNYQDVYLVGVDGSPNYTLRSLSQRSAAQGEPLI